MAAPTFIGAANAPTSGDTSVASRSVTKPAGAQFAVFFMAAWQTGGGTPDPTPPSGAAQRLKQPTGGGSGETSWIYLKYVDGDATGTTYTFTFSSAKFCALKAQFWDGVEPGLTLTSSTDFPGAAAANTSTTTYPSVSATTTVADSALAWGGNSYDYNSGTATTPAPGFTETGDTVASAMSYRVVSAAGLQTVSGATYGETTNLHALLVALPGASTGGTPVEGTGAGSFGFSGTATGVRRVDGAVTGSFGFTGTADGVDRSVGSGAGSFGFVGTAAGKRTVAGAAAASFGFAAVALGVRGTGGAATGDFGFIGTAQGFAGTPPVLGAGTGSFGFTGTAEGTPRVVGAASASFGYAGTADGTVVVLAAASSSFGFTTAAAALRRVIAAAAGAFGFTGTAAGFNPNSYTPVLEPVAETRQQEGTASTRDLNGTASTRESS